MSESDDYLQPGFDPSSITVPRLRSILVTHNIQYPATAKKPQLITLFNDQVIPMAPKVLAERARAKRTSHGIFDAHSSTETTGSTDVYDYDDNYASRRAVNLPYPPAHPPSRSARRSTSPRKISAPVRVRDENHDATPVARRTGRSTSRSIHPSESEDDPSRSARRPKRTAPATPRVIKQEEDSATATPRQSLKTPSRYRYDDDGVGVAVHDDDDDDDDDDGNPFSSDNPFQSGSSPLSGSKSGGKSGSKSSRRKTGEVEPAPAKKRETPGQTRRVTDGPSMFGRGDYDSYNMGSVPAAGRRITSARAESSPFKPAARAPAPAPAPAPAAELFPPKFQKRVVSQSATSFRVPMSQLMQPRQQQTKITTPEPRDQSMEPGEEFTPDQQLELAQAEAVDRHLAISRRKPPRRQNSSVSFSRALWSLLAVLAAAYLALYRQERIATGYCGFEDESQHLIPKEIAVPDVIAPYLQPDCLPCPKHAYCQPNMRVDCDPGFVATPHPLSMWGLVPLPPTCEPDNAKARKVKALADRGVEILRELRAKHECGDGNKNGDEEGASPANGPEIEASKLRETIFNQRGKKLNPREFDDLWDGALGDIKGRDEVEVATNHPTDSSDLSDPYLSSSSLARLPITCAAKRWLHHSVARYRFPVGALTAVVGIFLWARARYRRHAAVSARIPTLVDLVLSRLATQRELGEEGIDDGFLFQPHLRDDILRSIHSLREREQLWAKVRAYVEQNANVRISQREGRNGEIGRAWEWIGPTTEAASALRRRTGRVSFGPDVRLSEKNGAGGGVRVKMEEEGREVGPAATSRVTERWSEGGRPIF